MEMPYLYCGIKFPAPRNFERIKVENVNFSENSAALKERILSEILKTKDEISLVYLGNILNDDEPISKQPIKSGSTIHVLKKPKEEEVKIYSKFTEVDVSRISSLYRSLHSGNFHVSTIYAFIFFVVTFPHFHVHKENLKAGSH